MGKKPTTLDDLNGMDKILSGPRLDIDSVIGSIEGTGAEAPAAVDAASETEPLPTTETGLEAAPAPEPKKAEPDEPEPEPDDKDFETWVSTLPEAARARATALSKQTNSLKVALAKRGDRLEQAEEERRDAIRIALTEKRGRTELEAFLEKAKPGAAPADAEPMMELEVGEDGKIRLPLAKLREIVDRQDAPRREADATRTALIENGVRANQLLSEAGVSTETSNKLQSAIREMGALYHEGARTLGINPMGQQRAGELEVLKRTGGLEKLAAKYPGVDPEDLYDMLQGVTDPATFGRHMVKAAKHYHELWAAPGSAARPAVPAKPRVPEHVSPAARRGAVDKVVGTTQDRIAGLTLNDVVGRKVSDAELIETWEKEFAGA